MMDAGVLVVTAFISPYRDDRRLARSLVDEGDFVEVYVNAPLEVCEQRPGFGRAGSPRQRRKAREIRHPEPFILKPPEAIRPPVASARVDRGIQAGF